VTVGERNLHRQPALRRSDVDERLTDIDQPPGQDIFFLIRRLGLAKCHQMDYRLLGQCNAR
jgi:hypothetical protein